MIGKRRKGNFTSAEITVPITLLGLEKKKKGSAICCQQKKFGQINADQFERKALANYQKKEKGGRSVLLLQDSGIDLPLDASAGKKVISTRKKKESSQPWGKRPCFHIGQRGGTIGLSQNAEKGERGKRKGPGFAPATRGKKREVLNWEGPSRDEPGNTVTDAKEWWSCG